MKWLSSNIFNNTLMFTKRYRVGIHSVYNYLIITRISKNCIRHVELQITEKVSDLEPRDQEHLPFNAVILQRLENIINNFETSEQGEAFFSKTKPLWDEVTRCLRDPEEVVVAPKSRISTAYRNKFEENDVVPGSSEGSFRSTSVLLQQLMGNSAYTDTFSIFIN